MYSLPKIYIIFYSISMQAINWRTKANLLERWNIMNSTVWVFCHSWDQLRAFLVLPLGCNLPLKHDHTILVEAMYFITAIYVHDHSWLTMLDYQHRGHQIATAVTKVILLQVLSYTFFFLLIILSSNPYLSISLNLCQQSVDISAFNHNHFLIIVTPKIW